MTEKTLRSISRLFLACVPVAELRKLLDAVPSELLTQEFQETLIGRTILHPTAAAYPPRPVYIRNFLKCLINKLEEKKCRDRRQPVRPLCRETRRREQR
uniref:Protein containing Methyltransf 16 domain n=1 Tax=Rhipicephalus zambeziensis TaxID=60191 RepID=A0A224YWP7_9ACAR